LWKKDFDCCDAEKLFPAEKEVPEDNKKNSSNIP